MSLTERERAIRRRLRDDLPHYAERCLKILTKAGELKPLILNRAQQHLHAKLEEQLARTGKVRALVLKARQQGFSTYIEGRYFHRTSHARGRKCFILTHEQAATDNLFAMVDRFYEHCPALVRPLAGAANAKELVFRRLDSSYSVATAGTKAVGRSKTIQLFHGSEVAFWPNAKAHFAGVVQAIPDLPGTEVILESTANGPAGEFYERWQQAEAGIGDYIAVFVPWFWSEEYRRAPEPGFSLDPDEAEYAELHGLDLEQMAWRRAKLQELKDPLLFMQEYPATAAEAFQATGHDSFIKAESVLRARKATCHPHGPVVAGADPARFGDDRFSICVRQGRKVRLLQSKAKLDVVEGANWCRQVIDEWNPKRMFIDVGGLGAGVIDILRSWGGKYARVVVAVNFGGKPHKPNPTDKDGREQGGYLNRRAEMWAATKEWLDQPGGVDLPDVDSLQADACGPSYSYDMAQRLQLESKEAMRKRGVRSPDEWDAVALTFAEPVLEGVMPSQLEIQHYGVV